MLTVKLEKRSQKVKNLLADLKELAKQKVEVGHFAEQGIHPTSGMPYPMLMALHHFGNPNQNIPPRPVRTIVVNGTTRTLRDSSLKSDLMHWGKAQERQGETRKVLDTIGEALRESGKSIFGSSQLAPNSDKTNNPSQPLIDTNHLQRHYAYKTSINKTIKES